MKTDYFKFILFCFWTICLLASCEEDYPPENQSLPFLNDSVQIVVNPFNIAPLTAQALFTTNQAVKVQYILSNTNEILWQGNELLKEHSIDIMGLLPNVINEIELKLTDANENYQSIKLKIQTEALADYLPAIDIKVNSASSEDGWNMVSMLYAKESKYWAAPFIFDSEGRVRWYFNLPEEFRIAGPFEKLKNGNLIAAADHTVYEFSRMGEIINSWQIEPYRMHHDIFEMPNGNLLIPTSSPEVLSIFDQLVELDVQTGLLVNEWDFREILDANRQTMGNGQGDWLHVNSVWFDESDNTIVASARSQGIFKMDMTGAVKWIIAPHKGWGNTGIGDTGPDANDFLLTAIDANNTAFDNQIQTGMQSHTKFDWPWLQHAAMVSNTGNILAFDNGDYRNYSFNEEKYSRVVEYEINENDKTIKQVWTYGEDRGLDYFSAITGDIDILPVTQNRLVASLIIRDSDFNKGYITELAYPSNNIVFEALISYSNANSNGTNMWSDFDYAFRAERMTMYP